MPTSYTSLLGMALPVTGELSGTWGDTVNDYITKYVDAAVAGAQTISGSQTAVTLSTTQGGVLTSAGAGSTGSAQYAIINCTGNPAGLLTVTAPATSKAYIVINATSTSQSVKIVGAGPTTGVTIVPGDKALVAWNGSDFVRVNASAGGSNTQVQYNSGGNFAGSANLTFDGTNLSLGTSTKIQGDFSNGTLANRTLFQTSTTNGATGIIAVPNGTSTFASLYAANAAAPTNASTIGITTATGATYLTSTRFGAGTFLPLQLLTSDTVRASIATDGTISLGSTAGAESLRVTPVASAVNYLQAAGATTGNAPSLTATGSDTNVGLTFSVKGQAPVTFTSTDASVASYGIELGDGNSGSRQTYIDFHSSAGTDYDLRIVRNTGANNTAQYINAGASGHRFNTSGGLQFEITHTASAVNYTQITGSATGVAPAVSAQGTDTNIDLQLSAKGTGAIRIGTLTGLLKGTSGAVSAAVSGTDYAPATSGTSILYGNGSGGFSNVTVGSGLSFSTGTLTATGSGGTVTTVSVASANGFAGTVANATTTPAITLTTSITGLLKGNGTAISAAAAGTDYAAATTGTNAQLLANNGSGGFSNVTVGSGLTYSAGTLTATATASTSIGLVRAVAINCILP